MKNWILNIELLQRMKKIAVIDTGINLEYREFKGKNIEIVDIKRRKIYKDINGHGTSCCGEILKYNPMASLVIIPILDENCICNLEELYNALLYCNDREDIGIINLSMSCNIDDYEIIELFESLINEIYKKGKILVVSNKNKVTDVEKIYPYNYKNVLSVTKSSQIYPYIIFDNKNNRCQVSNDFYFMPSMNQKYRIFYGNSSLTAKMTGLLSSEINKLKEKESSISKVVYLCNKRLQYIFKIENEIYSNIKQEEIQMVKDRLNKIWSVFRDKRDKILKQDIELERKYYSDNGGEFLQSVEKELGFQIDLREFTIEDLKSLNLLVEKCLYYGL